ncbi:unnamed protein product [Acanthoscelides obtectus]|uniref:DNA-directed DNA polymerase n=1 Tax=Acanthoscelides obtectus TaxID=200917 RepID=A0A9P0KX95_ACAOB|nr:unnamed protein product [Acanthoscelides obtectus]CAK1671915.1 hypothetical protein AOBTE_LOCUS28533 [Acanthoscelides obtectus]
MEVGNVKFLDSLNYFPMPLTALPKEFDLKELKKGYFPHLFNTLAHQNYVGPIPALNFYDPDHLKEDAREKLLKWHGERQAEGYVFDFQKEIVEYCISDVEILTQACLKFRDLMKTETTVDPFQESTTIASCCNKVFRRNFLKPETIGYGTAYCLKCQKHFCFCPESINYHILSEEEEEEDNSLICSESIESTPSPEAPASTAPGPSTTTTTTTTTKNIQQKQSYHCNKREKASALPNQPTKNITIQVITRYNWSWRLAKGSLLIFFFRHIIEGRFIKPETKMRGMTLIKNKTIETDQGANTDELLHYILVHKSVRKE